MNQDLENLNNRVIVPEFRYDDRRCCSKIFILFKIIGCIFYTTTLSTCDKTDIYIVMITSMFLSILNDIRYEYYHFIKLGTIFSSLNDFEKWKRSILPQLKMIFSGIEFAIKLLFLIKNFPPEFDFSVKNLCKFGDSIFKTHILILFSLYFIIGAFSCMIITCFYYPNLNQNTISQNTNSQRQRLVITLPNPIILKNLQTEECSICMDLDNTNNWIILSCGHKFHNSCIVQWVNTQQTCPICRHNIEVI